MVVGGKCVSDGEDGGREESVFGLDGFIAISHNMVERSWIVPAGADLVDNSDIPFNRQC